MAARQCAATAKGLKILAQNPGISIPFVAKSVGVMPSTLYRALEKSKPPIPPAPDQTPPQVEA